MPFLSLLDDRDIVYDRIASCVVDELNRVSPVLPGGYRKHRHHQWCTPNKGHVKLNQQVAAVVALMRAVPTWDGFTRNLQRAFPKKDVAIPLMIDDD